VSGFISTLSSHLTNLHSDTCNTVLMLLHATCVDEVKLLQMRFGIQYNIHATHLRSNFCWWRVEHGTIFMYYPTCAGEV